MDQTPRIFLAFLFLADVFFYPLLSPADTQRHVCVGISSGGSKKCRVCGGSTAAPRTSTAVRLAMPPCEVELLACGPCDYVSAAQSAALDESAPRKRPAAALDSSTTSRGLIKSKFGTACAMPYKKRKLKKSVKFSPASHFRVVECVPGEWCDGSGSATESDESPGGSPDVGSAAAEHAHDSRVGEEGGCTPGTPGAERSPPSSPSPPQNSPGFASTPSSPSVLHDQDIVTKDGDGPSTIGLICNALIMGLVDRRITNAATALEAMRAAITPPPASATHQQSSSQHSSATLSPTVSDGAAAHISLPAEGEPCGAVVIGDEVFDSVVERLQQLVEHLDRYQRVGLLPSTARLGRSFIPALKCLQVTLRVAAREQHNLDNDSEGRADEEDVEIITPKSPARDDEE